MDTLNDIDEPGEEYWDDYNGNYEENELWNDSNPNFSSKKLVTGIDLNDLCSGKEVLFNISDDKEEFFMPDEDIDEVIYSDSKTLREKRKASPLTCGFKELVSKMTNVTVDGFVKKQIITNGTGKTVPDHAYVTVHYNLYKESCELAFDSTYLRNRPEKFRLDQGEAILGLEYAVKSMKKNENSLFFIKWEVAFGAMGCPDRIGEKCDIVADITLMNFEEIDAEEDLKALSTFDIRKIDFKNFLNQAKKLLSNGSDEFTKGNTSNAICSYRKALRILDNLRLADEEEESLMLKQKVKCLVNLAVCFNKINKPEQACLVCQEVLSIDYKNVKANFHYGKANIALSNFKKAERFLFRADKLKPNDKDINNEIKKLNDKKALYDMKDKMFWKKAFKNEEKEETKEEEKPSPLNSFEQTLRMSLEECAKTRKTFVLPMAAHQNEQKIFEKLASEMNLEFEAQSEACIFKPKSTP